MLKVVSGWETSQHATLMGRVHRFRHAIFVEEKGWQDLRRADGLERDQFDDVHALHQICSRGDDIVGYQRLLPTIRPHLLTDVLGDLCRRPPPRGPVSSNGPASALRAAIANCAQAAIAPF